MSDLDKLRAFAQAVMKSWGCEIDAPELQELAEQHGLMVACPVDAPCHEDGCCMCRGGISNVLLSQDAAVNRTQE